MPNTTHGHPYPLGTDTPDAVRDIRALAESVDAADAAAAAATAAELLARGAYRSASGKSAAVPSGGSVAIVFPVGRFTVPPTVVVSPVVTAMPSAIIAAYAGSVTKDGCFIFVHSSTSLAAAAWANGISWHATQDTA